VGRSLPPLRVSANADTPLDAKTARQFGAEGIGLCRTEHMFFGDQRLAAMREMILSKAVGAREKALEKLLPLQRGDFIGIFREMAGLPVTIRLLDPPLHEFLPNAKSCERARRAEDETERCGLADRHGPRARRDRSQARVAATGESHS
jgi:phosphoenolpyruvate synthase/pyruvate phosphate dikinase